MLRSESLSFSYPLSEPLVFPDLKAEPGEHMLLMGQSGSGKTTLLQLLGGLRTPRTGQVNIANTSMYTLKPSQLDKFRGRHIGLIFQESHFVDALNVADNIGLAQYLAGLNIDRKRISTLLERLNIIHKTLSKPRALSVGEQQRVAIARALINKPDIILADEPTSALDDRNTEEVINVLKEEADNVNAVLIIVTHDQRLRNRVENRIMLD